ncbi:hypothetical protein VSS74_23090 [Conexibacter stalactiti]|uniref:SLC26A/SulP transporter domain-containing protein n=1 Tax=Conexibacter stalactiti TaxID=1940611 RepID=A0ABU4HV96_9ACTN|nr:hypothetical protein [Conexibacter stalactiti]MDW5597252.1 hypothetical protein [Conexibacter stalactiti]MEC5037894.1 hypothetical protein [Conexibacter stalactiti]
MLALVLFAVEVSLIPEPIGLDLSVTGSGLGALIAAVVGVCLRLPPLRLQQVIVGGTIFLGTLSAVALFALLLFS